ncbi:aminotransferase class IV [Myroides sp. 1354]|uniref:aminotransferase class IV n=1 Tax=unclassified Myroides TaxID=2642485 RepID=UPI00257576AE|nr:MULTISPECIES: aminotransferase class IV [unclassified Myroides]MDM1046607.1 aminotransferase class IV [Myroides sp. R163-1]MDM1057550.1 aminotransferase class IV [Myroides sp. 1354]MDM1070848.1 aminotransferase class IV [Myroides sp. 1372]
MINVNGKLVSTTALAIEENRGFLYGDAVFETVRVLDKKVLFAEDHYFRLMSSMRIMRMEIPMLFTLENFQEEIIKTVEAHTADAKAFRVRLTVYREATGKYLPQENKTIGFVATAEVLEEAVYTFHDQPYEVELYKDFYVAANLLSTVKTTNRAVNVLASIFASENDYQNCLLVNDKKNIIEAVNGNLFVVSQNTIKTPPLDEGCVKGVMRKQIIELIGKHPDYTLEEGAISPFELQKADEIFITNVIVGIQPVTKYRKKTFTTQVAKDLLDRLNAKIRLM